MTKKKTEKKITCIAYLSTRSNERNVRQKEKQQLNYIREYAKAHKIIIGKVLRKDLLGQEGIDRHFKYMLNLIRTGQVDGIITANMLSISANEPDAYYKVGKVKEAGGVMVTVEEGRLGMYIERGDVNYEK